mmetsp:Transcript_30529/g.45170  ORF Transcript_30529/g.45170 Transcript_30529/m.45170 type:complete len:356 (-) Transcript_30529:519-1586(-)
MVDPIAAVKASCARVAKLSTRVQINDKACHEFALDLVLRLDELRASVQQKDNALFHDYWDEWTLSMGWKPQTIEEEASAMASLHLLNIGHGHKKLLRKLKLGQYKFGGYGSAYVTVMEGVGRAALKGHIDSQRMIEWTADETNECFLLPSDSLFATQITEILQESGSALLSKGYSSLGDFIIKTISTLPNRDVSSFIDHVISLIPAFCDEIAYKLSDGKVLTVHFFKKAFLLAKDIPFRFRSRGNIYDLKGLESLTVMADNVLPSVLRGRGILVLDDEASKKVASGTLPMGGLETELRALSVEASERIVCIVNENLNDKDPLTSAELDLWLWGVLGKEERLREAPRHFTPTTVFY